MPRPFQISRLNISSLAPIGKARRAPGMTRYRYPIWIFREGGPEYVGEDGTRQNDSDVNVVIGMLHGHALKPTLEQ